MSKRGRPTKFTLTYAQRQWDNYSPYYPMKEPNAKELKQYYSEKQLLTMNKVLSNIANLAGYESSEAIITILSKRMLGLVYN